MGGDIVLTSVINEGSLYALRVPVQVTLSSTLVNTPPCEKPRRQDGDTAGDVSSCLVMEAQQA